MDEDLRSLPYFLDRCRISTTSKQEVDNDNPITNCRGRKYKLLPCISDIVSIPEHQLKSLWQNASNEFALDGGEPGSRNRILALKGRYFKPLSQFPILN